MDDKTNSLASSLTAGLCGAAALTAIHQLATRVTDNAPRMDVLGERAISRGLEAAGEGVPPQPVLHRWALVGDLLANSAYYSLVAAGDPAHYWRRGAALGLAAGAGALVLPRPMGLGDPPKSDSFANKIMTVSWYLLGGLVAAAVASRGTGAARRSSPGGSRQPSYT
ncbi:hypothetical protein BH24ACI4_BH24ACI4_08640 [soil metagenome]